MKFVESVRSVWLGDRNAQLVQFYSSPAERFMKECIKNLLTIDDGQQLTCYEWEGYPSLPELLEICGGAQAVECLVYLMDKQKVTAPIAPVTEQELAEVEDDRIDAEYSERFPYAGFEVDCGF